MMDYAGNGGTCTFYTGWWAAPNAGVDGPITQSGNGVITLAQIVNGTSSTVLLGEKCLNRDRLMDRREDDDSGWASGWDCDINRWCQLEPYPTMADYDMATETEMGNAGYTIYDYCYYGAFGSSHLGDRISPCATAPCDRSITLFLITFSRSCVSKKLAALPDNTLDRQDARLRRKLLMSRVFSRLRTMPAGGSARRKAE